MRLGAAALLLVGCAASDPGVTLISGDFSGGRAPVLDGTLMMWNDAHTFNAGYERRRTSAFEVLATGAVFRPENDLLTLDGDAFLDVIHAFRFGDALHLRFPDADALRQGQVIVVDSEAGNRDVQLSLKIGAERLAGSSETDDPRMGFRLPGHLKATITLSALQRDADGLIERLTLNVDLTVTRCDDEGGVYREGSFVVELVDGAMNERMAEHNLKLLLGLSPLPLPDNNGFDFPGFTRSCSSNPRPPID
jgi:hypothetical protein